MKQETKELVDFIINKGYKIQTREYIEHMNGAIGYFAFGWTNIDKLKKRLENIIIYKDWSISELNKYLNSIKLDIIELESNIDGTNFDKEVVEIFKYINEISNKTDINQPTI